MGTARGRFTQSAPFQRLMASYSIEGEAVDSQAPALIHEDCAETVIVLEDGTSMVAIVEAILDHDCTCDE